MTTATTARDAVTAALAKGRDPHKSVSQLAALTGLPRREVIRALAELAAEGRLSRALLTDGRNGELVEKWSLRRPEPVAAPRGAELPAGGNLSAEEVAA